MRSARALQYDDTLTALDGFVRKLQYFYFCALNLLNVVYNVTVTKTGSAHAVMFLISNSLWFDWEFHRALLDYGLFFNATLFLSKDFEMSHRFRAENRPQLLLAGLKGNLSNNQSTVYEDETLFEQTDMTYQ